MSPHQRKMKPERDGIREHKRTNKNCKWQRCALTSWKKGAGSDSGVLSPFSIGGNRMIRPAVPAAKGGSMREVPVGNRDNNSTPRHSNMMARSKASTGFAKQKQNQKTAQRADI